VLYVGNSTANGEYNRADLPADYFAPGDVLAWDLPQSF
jgi:hypothetical protein